MAFTSNFAKERHWLELLFI